MKKSLMILSGVLGASVLALLLLILIFSNKYKNNVSPTKTSGNTGVLQGYSDDVPKWAVDFSRRIALDYIDINPYSRPGDKLKEVNAIVVHYVANPGTTAKQNRSYFNNLAETHEAKASSNFIIGLDGEVINCVPVDEVAYASNDRNEDTLSIECCHPDETGKFSTDTYDSLVNLTAYLCILYNLDPMNDVIRHYDVTGKSCPKYFVDHPEEWLSFKAQVQTKVKEK